MIRTTISAVVIALVFATGCGSAADQPRVDGSWKVTFKPKNYRGTVTKVTWYVTPSCKSGTCSFDFKSSGKLQGRFVYDKKSGGYELKKRTLSPCVAVNSNKVLVRLAYREDRKINFKVTGHRVEGGRKLATELRGEDVSVTAMTKEAVKAKCFSPGREVDQLAAVRVSPAPGATPPTK